MLRNSRLPRIDMMLSQSLLEFQYAPLHVGILNLHGLCMTSNCRSLSDAVGRATFRVSLPTWLATSLGIITPDLSGLKVIKYKDPVRV